MSIDLRKRLKLSHGYEEDTVRPFLCLNVTNRCNLACSHCFFVRDGNPNEPVSAHLELPDEEMREIIAAVRDRHSCVAAVWIGGEPMLRRPLLESLVPLFKFHTITTNGTIPLVDLGPSVVYLVSLDGPPQINDAIRGEGTFARVVRNLERVPEGFASTVYVQCTVTRANQGHLAEFVNFFLGTRVRFVTFSFYVPAAHDTSGLGWSTLEERMAAVNEVRRLKHEHPDFVSNDLKALDLMAPEHAPAVVADCAFKRVMLPLFLERDGFTTAFCTYGNNVDCALCGAWIAYEFAATPFYYPPVAAGV